MAFDGITISNIVWELQQTVLDGRIYKIAQPEKDELLLTIKNNGKQHLLFISAGASLPLIYLTKNKKTSPLTAPNFCMLLRKHLQNGRICRIYQPGLERIIIFEIEHLDELGDVCRKKLIIEIMGKHSNIIFANLEDMILDSIKHVPFHISSVREVLPGKPYFIPNTMEKANPLEVPQDRFYTLVYGKPIGLAKAVYTSFTGISPFMAAELCFQASLDGDHPANCLNENEQIHFHHTFLHMIDRVKEGNFSPQIILDGKKPIEFASLNMSRYPEEIKQHFTSISELLENYYAVRNVLTRIHQKSADLRRIVQTALERNRKKYDLQIKQLKDTEKREKYKVYGELLNTYGYHIEPNAKSLKALNYYTNEEIIIPLNPDLDGIGNAKKYFERYNKLKRTNEALQVLTKETADEIMHLESVVNALDIAGNEDDILQIKEELTEAGYIKKKYSKKKITLKSKPFHYISKDGFHIYVGKNNLQNDELTFQFANGGDWWFHAKQMPGSHVIVKTNGQELTDQTFEEAGRLAAYYSKGRDAEKVEIDYTEKKNIKKPSGGKPGFVIYHTNYSLLIDSDISDIKRLYD